VARSSPGTIRSGRCSAIALEKDCSGGQPPIVRDLARATGHLDGMAWRTNGINYKSAFCQGHGQPGGRDPPARRYDQNRRFQVIGLPTSSGIHEPLGGVQIYERQLVEGTITVPFQEARKVVDRLVTAAESVVYTPFAAVRFHWQRWRGYRLRPSRDFPKVRCVSRLLYTRLTAQNLLNSQNSVGWQWSHAKGTHPFSRA